jgi:hypothetical protein
MILHILDVLSHCWELDLILWIFVVWGIQVEDYSSSIGLGVSKVVVIDNSVGSNLDLERPKIRWEDGRLVPATTFQKEGAVPPPTMSAIKGNRGRIKDLH